MPWKETGAVPMQTSMRELSIYSNNNTRFATFKKHIKEGRTTFSL